MKKTLLIRGLLGIGAVVMMGSAAHAYNGACGMRYSPTVDIVDDGDHHGHYDASESPKGGPGYAYCRDCELWYHPAVDPADGTDTSGDGAISESPTARPQNEFAHSETTACGGLWFRRWMGRHQHDCAWDATHASNGKRRTNRGCCW